MGGDLYVWSDTSNNWENVGHIQGPPGPQGIPGPIGPTGVSFQFQVGNVATLQPGTMAAVMQQTVGDHVLLDFAIPQGPTGPAGPYQIDSVFLATFNRNFPDTGYEVLDCERLPIDRIETDQANICVLNPDYTIQFNRRGTYRVEFIVSAYVPFFNTTFDPLVDFVSLGFRQVDDSVIYAGASEWIADEQPHQVIASGIFNVASTTTPYELYNFSGRRIYLNSPKIQDLTLHSYFLNPVITINIQYLGR